jgi:hypothetical protein
MRESHQGHGVAYILKEPHWLSHRVGEPPTFSSRRPTTRKVARKECVYFFFGVFLTSLTARPASDSVHAHGTSTGNGLWTDIRLSLSERLDRSLLTGREDLLQLFRLLWVVHREGVEVPRAANLEFGQDLAVRSLWRVLLYPRSYLPCM